MKVLDKAVVVFLLLISFSFDLTFSDYKNNLGNLQNKIESQQSELSKIENEIKKYKENLNALSSKEKKIRRNIERKEKEIKKNKNKVNGLKIELHSVQLKTDELTGKLTKARNENNKYARDFKAHLDFYCIKKHRFEIAQQFIPVLRYVDNVGYVEQQLVRLPADKFCKTEKNIEKIAVIKERLDVEQKKIAKLKEKVVRALSEYIFQRKKQLKSLKKVKLSKKNKQAYPATAL